MSAFPRLGTDKTSRLLLALIAACAVLALAFSHPVGAATGGISRADDSDEEPAVAASRYDRIWWSFGVSERRWANRTAECESGRNPRAIGGSGLYRGAFQFMRSTWRASPKSPGGDPIAYPYRTQAVVAVLLKRRDGAGHWPVCG
jgi:transglycosylase-like protein